MRLSLWVVPTIAFVAAAAAIVQREAEPTADSTTATVAEPATIDDAPAQALPAVPSIVIDQADPLQLAPPAGRGLEPAWKFIDHVQTGEILSPSDVPVLAISNAKPVDSTEVAAKNSAGKGNSTHLIMEMLEERMGAHLIHIPYNGAARGLSGVMAGEVQLMADVLNTAAVQAKAGKVVPLAVVGSKRASSVPDVPTMAEAGFNNFPQPGWYAMVAPAGTPKAILDRLNAETQKFFADPNARARLDALQYEPLPGRPELVKEWMQRDAKVWGPVLTRLGISND